MSAPIPPCDHDERTKTDRSKLDNSLRSEVMLIQYQCRMASIECSVLLSKLDDLSNKLLELAGRLGK